SGSCLQRWSMVQPLQDGGIVLIQRHASLTEWCGRRISCRWASSVVLTSAVPASIAAPVSIAVIIGIRVAAGRRCGGRGGTQVPVTILRRADAVLVEAIGVCAGNNGWLVVQEVVALQRKQPVRKAIHLDDLDSLHGWCARTIHVEHADIGAARGVAGDLQPVG